MSTIKDIGEFGLIDLIKNKFIPHGPGTIVGIDDDCAVTEGRDGFHTIYTCDSQVEGSHFITERVPPFLLGQKVLAVNLSDIAAMGGSPRYALLSLVLRSDISLDWIDTFLNGFQQTAQRFRVDVIGGNLARTRGELVLDVTLIGEIKTGRLFLRNQAQVGDAILVTGCLGDAAAGLQILLEEQRIDSGREQYLLNRYFLPEPRIDVGKILGETDLRLSLIDISDGFSQDLGHILERSQVGAVVNVEHIPLSEALISWCSDRGFHPLDFALSGGEDYELIFCAPRSDAIHLQSLIQQKTGVPVSIVGEIVAGRELTMRKNGRDYPYQTRGWNHFTVKGKR